MQRRGVLQGGIGVIAAIPTASATAPVATAAAPGPAIAGLTPEAAALISPDFFAALSDAVISLSKVNRATGSYTERVSNSFALNKTPKYLQNGGKAFQYFGAFNGFTNDLSKIYFLRAIARDNPEYLNSLLKMASSSDSVGVLRDSAWDMISSALKEKVGAHLGDGFAYVMDWDVSNVDELIHALDREEKQIIANANAVFARIRDAFNPKHPEFDEYLSPQLRQHWLPLLQSLKEVGLYYQPTIEALQSAAITRVFNTCDSSSVNDHDDKKRFSLAIFQRDLERVRTPAQRAKILTDARALVRDSALERVIYIPSIDSDALGSIPTLNSLPIHIAEATESDQKKKVELEKMIRQVRQGLDERCERDFAQWFKNLN